MKKRKSSTREEFEKIARRVVYYYVNKANRSRKLTVKYFTKHENLHSNTVRRIVLKYEREGKVERNYAAGTGRKPAVFTPENLEKLKELLLTNPALTIREAAHLLNINTGSAQYMLSFVRGHKLSKNIPRKWRNVQLTSESSSSMADVTNSDKLTSSLKVDLESSVENGNLMTTGMKNTALEYHFKDDVPEQFADSFFDDHGNDIDDPVEHDVEEVCADLDLDTRTVKVKRKQKVKGKAKPVVGKNCVICLDKKAHYNRTKSSHVTTFEKNMRIIYLLKDVLKISSEELVGMMKATEGENPVDWVDMCESCYETVHEAMIAQQQLQTLQKTIADCKSKIVLKLKESLSLPRKKVKAVKQNVVSKRVREVFSMRKDDCESNTQESESPVNSSLEVKMKMQVEKVELDQPEREQDHRDWFDDDDAALESQVEAQTGASESEVVDKALEIADGTHEKTRNTEENGVPVVVTPVVFPVPKVSVICDLCGESTGKVSLPIHKLKTHGEVMEGFTLLSCEVSGCKYETLFEELMKQHVMRIHQGNRPRPRPFICLFCGKSFASNHNRKRHEDNHRNEETKPYKCDICGKGFAVGNNLYLHKRFTHSGRKFPPKKRPKT